MEARSEASTSSTSSAEGTRTSSLGVKGKQPKITRMKSPRTALDLKASLEKAVPGRTPQLTMETLTKTMRKKPRKSMVFLIRKRTSQRNLKMASPSTMT